MKHIARAVLHALARRVIERYRPQVVGITGSYGKTSTKEAIAAVLNEGYIVRPSQKSFNNEYGVPFTILGARSDGGPLSHWLSSYANGIRLLMRREPYPTILVIEMGADRPGDIRSLVGLVPVDVGVVTSIGQTHLQRFGTVDEVFQEKSILARELRTNGWAILNGDDPRVRTLAEVSPGRIVSYGFQSGVAVRCVDAAVGKSEDGQGWGMVFQIEFGKERFPVFLPGVVGRHSIYAGLAAVAVGVAFHMDVVEIAQGLRQYAPPPGRMRVFEGVKHTIIIDDSYNSSPDACVAALEALREFPTEKKRYALLGDMVDLGAATIVAHQRVGKAVVEEQIDVFVAVGEKMRDAVAEARTQGMDPDRIVAFDDPVTAAKFVQNRLDPGDVVLVKGSQLSRMEKAVKELMAEPERVEQLLVRQDPSWLRQ